MRGKLSSIILVFLQSFLASCSALEEPRNIWGEVLGERSQNTRALRPVDPSIERAFSSSNSSRSGELTVVDGTGSFHSNTPLYSVEENTGGRGITLNLVNAPIPTAAKTVLGDILGENYTVDPKVEGAITLQTTKPVSRSSLSGIFETALADQDIQILNQGGFYKIVPASVGANSFKKITRPGRKTIGSTIQVVPLEYVSASEIETILKPIAKEGSIVHTDTNRNLIMLSGTQNELRSLRETIAIFDVDWMRGKSFGLFPLSYSEPDAVATELENIFGANEGPLRDVVQFIPNKRLNSVLVTTKRSRYLKRAAAWITKLDNAAGKNDLQLFVYRIQNRSAVELANVLQSTFVDQEGSQISVATAVAPNQTPVSGSTNGATNISVESDISGGPSFPGRSGLEDGVHVTADTANNSLLIRAKPAEYERILKILKKIDTQPTQVLLEAVIAEVTLTDELQFGLRWFFEDGNSTFSLSDALTGLAASAIPGFSYTFATNDVQITLNALAGITDVNIISSPTLTVVDNKTAILQVGDQVPIVTQTATGVITNNAPIVNTVQLRDTGVILEVTPRVNESGKVALDISQEVSDVIETTTSGIDSPTIRQRKISTTVVVQDGENLVLGGLIQDQNSITRDQVPILGDIPIVGLLFKDKADIIRRTELIVFIRPSVIRDVHEARSVSEEFRQQLILREPKARRGRTTFERDLIRLAN